MGQVARDRLRRFAAAVAVCSAALVAAGPAPSAQAPTLQRFSVRDGSLARLVVVDVKPESWNEYLLFQKSEVMANLRNTHVERRLAWRTEGLGRSFQVLFVYPIPSLASFEAPGAFLLAMGTEGTESFDSRSAKLLDGVRSLAVRARADLGFGDVTAGHGDVAPLAVATRVLSQPGRQGEFEALVKAEWVPALKRAGVGAFKVYEVAYGGEVGEYYTLTAVRRFADLDASAPVGALLGGAQQRTLLARLGTIVRSLDRQVMRLDRQLGFDAAADDPPR